MSDHYFSSKSKDYGFKLRKETVKQNQIYGYTVDTCLVSNSVYQTAICYTNGDWITVEDYTNKLFAELGHENWCKFVKTMPTEAYDTYLESFVSFLE